MTNAFSSRCPICVNGFLVTVDAAACCAEENFYLSCNNCQRTFLLTPLLSGSSLEQISFVKEDSGDFSPSAA